MTIKSYYISKQTGYVNACNICSDFIKTNLLNIIKTESTIPSAYKAELTLNLHLNFATAKTVNSPCNGPSKIFPNHDKNFSNICMAKYIQDQTSEDLTARTSPLQQIVGFFDQVSDSYQESEFEQVPIFPIKINMHIARAMNVVSQEQYLDMHQKDPTLSQFVHWNLCTDCAMLLSKIAFPTVLELIHSEDLIAKQVIYDSLEQLISLIENQYHNSNANSHTYGVCSYGNCYKSDFVQYYSKEDFNLLDIQDLLETLVSKYSAFLTRNTQAYRSLFPEYVDNETIYKLRSLESTVQSNQLFLNEQQ